MAEVPRWQFGRQTDRRRIPIQDEWWWPRKNYVWGWWLFERDPNEGEQADGC
jgi:hypothetical protein